LLDDDGMVMKLVHVVHEPPVVEPLALAHGIVRAGVGLLLRATSDATGSHGGYREREDICL